MTTEQQRIYRDAYSAGIEALESTVAFRACRTAANERKANAACEAAIKAANAASAAKVALEYGEAYERLEEAACFAELVWLTLTKKAGNRMNRTALRAWAEKVKRLQAESSEINE